MERILLAAMLAAALGCASAERETVVTRDQFGAMWPLEVNSAKVLCSERGVVVLKVGTQRYALSEAARAHGYADAADVASADLAPLRAVCDTEVAAGP